MPRYLAPVLLLLGCGLQTGCVLLPTMHGPTGGPPMGCAQQIHAKWENRILTAQDSVNNGATLKGVAGRLYLFGPEIGFPVRAKGEVTVDLADISEVAKGGAPVLLERWTIDPVTLDRLLKKDAIGWGYTLFLPWASHKDEIRQVTLQVKFTPEKGSPLYSPPATVSFQPPDSAPQISRQTIRPIVRVADPNDTKPLQVDRVPWSK